MPNDHQEQIGRLFGETVALARGGHYAEAREPARQAVRLCRERLGPDHPLTATSLNNLGAVHRELGDLAEAEPCLREALEIDRRTRRASDPSLAVSLNELGLLYKTMGDYVRAEPLYRESLEIRRQALGEESEEYATSLNNLGLLYDALGDYAAAEPVLREAAEIQRRRTGEWHPAFAETLNNVAGLSHARGRYAEAETLYRRVVEILQGTVGEGHPRVALALQNLAGACRSLENYSEAGRLYHQAHDLLLQALGQDHPRIVDSLRSLGVFYAETAQLEAAAELFTQALQLGRRRLGVEAPDLVPTLVSLANTRTRQKRIEEARELLSEALRVSRQARGRESRPALEGLAGIAYETGQVAEAETLFGRVLEAARQEGGDDHPAVAGALHNLALARAAAGRPEAALEDLLEIAQRHDGLLAQAFTVGSEAERMAFLGLVQWHLSLVLSLVTGHLATEASAQRAALDLVLRRKGLGLEALAAQRDAVLGGKYPSLQAELRQLTNLRRQIARARLEGRGSQSGEGAAARRDALHEWEARAGQIERDLARQIPEMGLDAKLRTASRRAVAIALPPGSVLLEFVRYWRFDFLAPTRGESGWGAGLRELTPRGGPREALASAPAAYAAFVLPAGAPDEVTLVDLGAAEPIDALVATFRAALTGNTETRPARDLGALPVERGAATAEDGGAALHRALLATVTKALGERTQLVVAPDGELCRLPLEVLPLPDGGRAVDAYQLTYVGCGRDVLRWGEGRSGQAGPAVVAANPDFDLGGPKPTRAPARAEGRGLRWPWRRATPALPTPGPRPAAIAVEEPRGAHLRGAGISFTPLPGTRIEGERISVLLGTEAWMGGKANEGLIKALASPRILHIATHGFFLADRSRAGGGEAPGLAAAGGGRLLGAGHENPLLRSGLALAGANTWLRGDAPPEEAEDGILSAEDVSGLDLLATELVVLSACETGLGEVRTGEGVFGLRRSFTVAGAKTLVISLWKVPDEQTQELMEAFYSALLAGRPRAAALRAAQLHIKSRHPEPLYWGAFICEGDPGPLGR